MAGFFGLFNYAKPGKGVDKNAPEKKRFFLFFELLWRKLFKIIGLNIIYFIATLPVTSWLVLTLLNAVGMDAEIVANDVLLTLYVYVVSGPPKAISYGLIAMSAILYGPITAGVTYAYRNFARQEHVWIMSDLFEKTKQNFKQGLIAGLVDILVVYSSIMYLGADISDGSLMSQYFTIFKFVASIVFIIYSIMRFYIYTIMVTFELKYIAILRNSWLFCILGIFRNLCTIFFCGIVIVLSSFLGIVAFPLLTYGLTGFITVFNAYPVIDKYMISKINEMKKVSVGVEYLDGEENKDEPIFVDDVNHYNKSKDDE